MSTENYIGAQIAYWGIFEHGYIFSVLKAVLKPENRASSKLFMKKFIAGATNSQKLFTILFVKQGKLNSKKIEGGVIL